MTDLSEAEEDEVRLEETQVGCRRFACFGKPGTKAGFWWFERQVASPTFSRTDQLCTFDTTSIDEGIAQFPARASRAKWSRLLADARVLFHLRFGELSQNR